MKLLVPFFLIIFLFQNRTMARFRACKHPVYGSNPGIIKVYINSTCLSGCPGETCDPANDPNCNCEVDPNNPHTCKCAPYDPDNSECWNYDVYMFKKAVVNMINEWNVSGGANVIFRYMGTDVTGKKYISEMNSDEVLVKVDWYFIPPQDPNDIKNQCYASAAMCGKEVSFTVYDRRCSPHKRRWTFYWDHPANDDLGWYKNFTSIGIHEFGHILGFNHPTDTEPSQKGPTVMGIYGGARHNFKIWPLDIYYLKYDELYGYGTRTSQILKHFRSYNEETFTDSEPTPSYSANLTPGVAFGSTDNTSLSYCYYPPCPSYTVAFTKAVNDYFLDDYIYKYQTNGVNYSEVSVLAGARTQIGLDVAYGNTADGSKYLLVYLNKDTLEEKTDGTTTRIFYYSVSSDGLNFSSPSILTINGNYLHGRTKPKLVYNQAAGVFHLFYGYYGYSEELDGCICAATYKKVARTGWKWTNSVCSNYCTVGGYSDFHRTIWGIGAECNSSNECIIYYPYANTGQNYFVILPGYYDSSTGEFIFNTPEFDLVTDYTSVPPDVCYDSLHNHLTYSFKGFWFFPSNIRTRQGYFSHPSNWFNYQTLGYPSLSGVSIEFSDHWNERVIYYSTIE